MPSIWDATMSTYPTYLKDALLYQLNIVVVAAFALLGLVSWNLLPLIIGGIAEAAWLIAAPASPAFRRAVDRKKRSDSLIDIEDRNTKLMQGLPDNIRGRFNALLRIVEDIRTAQSSYGKVDEDFFSQFSLRLDDMCARYAEMLSEQYAYDKLIQSGDAAGIEARLAELRSDAGGDEQVIEVRKRECDILEKRLEHLNKADKDKTLVGAQLDAIDEMVKLFREQAVTMKSPKEITGRLDNIMNEFEIRSSTIAELEGEAGELFDKQLADAEKKRIS
jgi:hypothetical protein